MAGLAAPDLVLDVPIGTIVLDAERGNVLKDLDAEGMSFVVARGGGGWARQRAVLVIRQSCASDSRSGAGR